MKEQALFETPILFLIFNRPDLTKIAFARIREIRPKHLFIGSDGPRKDHPEDKENCELARRIVLDMIDWNCELKTLFQKDNLGCGLGPYTAINWFFSNIRAGIIIEDDVLPGFSFFKYTEQLLEYYRDNKKVMHIGGLNWQNGIIRDKYSYYFSKYPGIWGWATWKDRWEKMDFYLENLDEFIRVNKIYNITKNKSEAQYHLKTFNAAKCMLESNLHIWDYQWKFTIFNHDGYCITPNKNLISNRGWREDATHTKDELSWRANGNIDELSFPLLHPAKIKRHVNADKYTAKQIFIPKKTIIDQIKDKFTMARLKNIIASSICFFSPFIGIQDKIKCRYSFYSNFKKNGNHLFVACFPKSGSTYLVNLLRQLFKLRFVVFINSFGQNEHDLYEPILLDNYSTNTVTHQHLRATDHNLYLLKKYNIKPLILVRNIYDCVVSIRDHCVNETYKWPMAHINSSFLDKTETEQYDLIIDYFLPWYINFYVSWIDASKNLDYELLWVRYEDFIGKESKILDTISEYYNLPQKTQNEISDTITITTGEGNQKSRLNLGIQGRGMMKLKKYQIARIESLLKHHSNVDFSPIKE